VIKYKNKYLKIKNILGGDLTCNGNRSIEENITEINKITKLEQKEIDDLIFYFSNSMFGPTNYSNWVIKDRILMGAIPKSCDDLNIFKKNGITLFVSLREEDEIYQTCDHYDNIIFWRFRIPDLSTREPEDLKALIDNLINYLINDKNRKIMIHCLGGHGRTGTVICCLLAVIIFLNKNEDQKDIVKKIQNEIENLRKENNNYKNIEEKIIEISEKIFKYVKFYTMLSLSSHRQTDSLDNRTVKEISIPETSAQELLICQVIQLYIKLYLKNKYYSITREILIPNEIKKCNDNNSINEEHQKIWKCANLKSCN